MLPKAGWWWKIKADTVPKFHIKNSIQSGEREQKIQHFCFLVIILLFCHNTWTEHKHWFIQYIPDCVTHRWLNDSWMATGYSTLKNGNEIKASWSYNSYLSMWSFWAKSCQSFPLALAVSKVALILWRMDRGILKALDPVWEVMVQSDWVKKGTTPFSF